MNERKKERIVELLSDQALFGLTDAEFAELAELENEFPEFGDDSFELAAASIGMINLDTSEPLPAHLRERIVADADKYFAASKAEAPVETVAAATPETGPEELQKTFEFEPRRSFLSWLGWGVAAAACLVLAVNLYLTRGLKPDELSKNPTPTPTAAPNKELTPAEQRDRLLASAKDVVRAAWTGAKPANATQITGEVVWSDTAQQGFLTFRGLAPNDPARETYQLWIVDETRDKYPVDGGVFDVRSDGEIVVPIDAKLKVAHPKVFALTKEKPGGVVVSAQGDKLVAVAKIAV
ncbi:MAG: anti-sigma factor [Acidobacteria bacterium]|nr:anti-sigma factor [Acidobacteriota bacterium]